MLFLFVPAFEPPREIGMIRFRQLQAVLFAERFDLFRDVPAVVTDSVDGVSSTVSSSGELSRFPQYPHLPVMLTAARLHCLHVDSIDVLWFPARKLCDRHVGLGRVDRSPALDWMCAIYNYGTLNTQFRTKVT